VTSDVTKGEKTPKTHGARRLNKPSLTACRRERFIRSRGGGKMTSDILHGWRTSTACEGKRQKQVRNGQTTGVSPFQRSLSTFDAARGSWARNLLRSCDR
jgi:hypothetical protein